MRFLRARPVGVDLFFLVIVTVVPILLFVGVLLAELKDDVRAQAQIQADAAAAARAAFAAGQIRDMSVTLKVIASSQQLAAGNLEGFYARTEPALAGSSWYLLLVTEDGTQLLNSRVPFGRPLGKTSDTESLKAALRSGEPLVSNIFFGQVSGQWVFNVIYPLPPNRPGAALILTQNISDIDARFDSQPLPPGWHSRLVDGNGRIVAASDPNATLGSPPIALSKPADVNVRSIVKVDGTENWRSVVWGNTEMIAPLLRWSWWSLLATGIALVGLSAACALLVARSIRRSVSALADMAVAMGEGRIVAVPDLALTEARTIAGAFHAAALRRQEAESRLSVALRELAHRLKNLVTVVQAIVHQSGRRAADTAEFRRQIDSRLLGLVRSIDLLTDHAADDVPLRALVQRQLEAFVADPSVYTAEGEQIAIRENAVQGVGMILHELATNAAKYGALARPGAVLTITWKRNPANGHLELEWREQSIEHEPAGKGFGTTLIESTVRSFGGSATLVREAGFRSWRLTLDVVSGNSLGPPSNAEAAEAQ